ncbi:MAG: glycosyltransferase [Thermoleophilia bacterium]
MELIDHLGWGGAERLLLQYLPYLRDSGFDVRVCALGEREGNPVADEIRALGFPVDRVEVAKVRDATAIPRIRRYLRAIGADLVHSHSRSSRTASAPWPPAWRACPPCPRCTP